MGIINRLIIHLGSKPNSYSLNHHHHQYHHHHHHQSSNNWSRIKPNSSLPLCRLDFRLTAGFSRPLTYERQNKSIKCPALPQQSYFDDLLPVSCHSLTLFRILLPFQNQMRNHISAHLSPSHPSSDSSFHVRESWLARGIHIWFQIPSFHLCLNQNKVLLRLWNCLSSRD